MKDSALCGALVLLVSVNHLAFGGGRLDIQLGFAAAYGLLGLVTALVLNPARSFARLQGITGEAGLFLLLLLTTAAGVVGWGASVGNPIWEAVGARQAASLDRSATLLQMIQLCTLASIFGTGRLLGASRPRAERFLRMLLDAGVVFAAWAIIAHIVDPASTFGIAKRIHPARLTASFVSANTAATLFGSLLVLGAAHLALSTERYRAGPPRSDRAARILLWPVVRIIVLAAALGLTASRGGAAAAGVGVVLFAGWTLFSPKGRASKGATAIALGAAAACALLLWLSSDQLVSRMLQVQDDVHLRSQVLEMRWRAVLDSPLLGYGLGSFDAVSNLYTTPSTYPFIVNVHAAHNVYLEWLEQGGALGAGAMFLLIGWILFRCVRGALEQTPGLWLKGVVAASVAILVHGLTDYALEIPSIEAYWACLLGVGSSLAQSDRRSAPRSRGAAQALKASAVAAGAALAALSTVAAVRVASPTISWAQALAPIASADSRAADILLNRAWETGSTSLRQEAEILTRRELDNAPSSSTGWFRLAYIEVENSGRLTPPAIAHLRRSFLTGALDPRLIARRSRLVYDRWPEMPEDLRQQAMTHVEASWRAGRREPLLALVPTIHPVEGRLALGMKLASLRNLSALEERQRRAAMRAAP